MNISDHEKEPRHVSENRRTSESKIRRSGRNCPICLVAFPKNARGTKRIRMCPACQAHPSVTKSCNRCAAEAIWENKQSAACQSCGNHGSKFEVVAA